ncbi:MULTISPECIES: hypothetical protein [Rhizobium]|uniref:Uncharacterized protein n=2 Tax=Rhizobium favelukesii TaxID=348824 RepID=W6RPL5_9HYPH|nr:MULTISPECIES: hypothetical protein [Rhizobium]MCS0462525.1 hypothetical protein [Rhizobium favelukesii]UFS79412.1 hypothetical protein LPB79_07460 [Rhizobium sp. T136]CDM62977.1 hypothetical protein LPU83_pLPU83d_1607 [Rhizobium favelukesii]
MEDPRFNSFRYGLAVLLMRHPHLRPYAHSAHWWIEDIENYADAVRFRDKLRAEGDNKMLLEEYEQICIELEEEVLSYFGASALDPP